MDFGYNFHLFTIMENSAMNLYLQASVWAYVAIFLNIYT